MSFPGAYTVQPRVSLAPSQMIRGAWRNLPAVFGLGNGLGPTPRPVSRQASIGTAPSAPQTSNTQTTNVMASSNYLAVVAQNGLLVGEVDDAIRQGLTPTEYASIFSTWPPSMTTDAGGGPDSVPTPSQFAARYAQLSGGGAGAMPAWVLPAAIAGAVWFFFLRKRR